MLACFGFASMAIAQNNDMTSKGEVDMDDYERYFDKVLEMEYRKSTINALEMTSEEIEKFNPIFDNYMNDKQKIVKERMKLLEEFKEEMSEDDSEKNMDDDRADFIEGYLQASIDEKKLQKKYFDEIEDEISVDKAIKFLLWEDMIEDRMNTRTIVKYVPMPMDIQYWSMDNDSDKNMGTNNNDAKYKDMKSKEMKNEGMKDKEMKNKEMKNSVKNYSSWVLDHDGDVDISHDYTYTGVSKMMAVLEQMNNSKMLSTTSFASEKEKIMNMVAKLKKDPTSNDHADIAKRTFTAIASLMNNNDNLMQAANKIDVDELMTNQASTIKNFFKTAHTEIQSVSKMQVKSEEKMRKN